MDDRYKLEEKLQALEAENALLRAQLMAKENRFSADSSIPSNPDIFPLPHNSNQLQASLALKLLNATCADDVFCLLASSLEETLPGAILTVARFLPDGKSFVLADVKGIEDSLMHKALSLIGFNYHNHPFQRLQGDEFEPRRFTRLENGFERLLSPAFPPSITRKLLKLTGIKEVYTISIKVNQLAFGSVAVMTRNKDYQPDKELVEALVFQCANALQQLSTLEQLRKGEEKYRLLFNNMTQAFALHEIILDKNGKPVDYIYLDANPAFGKLTGLNPSKVIGKKISELLPDTEGYWIDLFGRVAVTGKSERYVNYSAALGKFFETQVFCPVKGQFAVVFHDVSAEKQALKALEESEQKYRNLFESNRDGIFIVELNDDLSIKIVELNEAATHMLGYANLNQQTLNPVIFEYNSSFLDYAKRVGELKKQGSVEFETRLIHKDGRPIDFHIKAVLIDYMGKPAVYNILRETTPQKQMERVMKARLDLIELAQTNSFSELLRKMLGFAEELTHSKIGFYTFYNEEKAEVSISEFSESTLDGYCEVPPHMQTHYPLEQAGVWADAIRQRKPVIHNNYTAMPGKKGMPQGHSPVIREMVVPIFRHNKITGLLALGNKPWDYTREDVELVNYLADFAWDIAEEKIAREELLKSEEKYRLIFDRSPLGVLHFDSKSVITDCNEPFVKIIGSSREKLIGLNMLTLPDTRIVKAVQQVVNGQPAYFEGVYKSATAKKITPVRLLFSPILNKDGSLEGGIGLVEDRSDQFAKEEYRKQVAIAEESVRFKQNFLANMSHEIRTPLTGVMGMIDILEHTSLSKKQQEYLEILRSSGENLKELINQVLDFSKIEAGKMKLTQGVFRFRRLMENNYKLFQTLTDKKKLRFETVVDPAIPSHIKADRYRLMQVLNNLVSNAVKFTNRGEITINSHLVERIPGTGEIIIRVEVKDTGIGIAPDNLSSLFQPFIQIDDGDTRRYEGTGLGLSICKELVELHGGEIGVESNYRKGSTFWFTFKAQSVSEQEIECENKTASESAVGLKKLRVLLAEDKLLNQKVISLMLGNKGHEITTVCNGKQLLKLYEPGKFDLILMDIQMPLMDGIITTRELRKKHNQLPPIVGLSANAFEGDKEKYMSCGMDDYLTKPLNMDDFQDMLQRVFKDL